MAQAEAFAANTTTAYLIPQSSQQAPPSPQGNQDFEPEIKDFNDQHQDSEEEKEAAITEELEYPWQENERLRVEPENMTRLRVAITRKSYNSKLHKKEQD
jgi:hypothetical protein